MKRTPFQLAKWALLVSSALMILVVCLPSPAPLNAWMIAQADRYQQRILQELNPQPSAFESPTQIAERQLPEVSRPQQEIAAERKPPPFRTAQLPQRSELGDRPPRGVRMQNPIFFPDNDERTSPGLAPDPVHLEMPARDEATPPLFAPFPE